MDMFEIVADLTDRLFGGDRAVAGYDDVRVEAEQQVAGGEPAGEGAVPDDRLAPAKTMSPV